MSSTNNVVLYRYDASPFAQKIDNVLLLKGIQHQRVKVAPALPRPEISEQLGISYRRIPLLAIGNDVYCDTSLIVSTLERRFPQSQGFGTVFPPKKNGGKPDTGLLKAYAQAYPEGIIFPLVTVFLPWEKFPKSFVNDRSDMFGAPLNLQATIAARSKNLSTLSSHITLVEEQLADGREWLFDTETPSLADISTHFIFNWLKGYPTSKALFDQQRFPYFLQWLSRTNEFLEKCRQAKSWAQPAAITGEAAAKAIAAASSEPQGVVGFDETEASRLGIQQGALVSVAPTDTGTSHPTTGKLLGINREEVVIEVQGAHGALKCHFPRLGFSTKLAKAAKVKL